MFSGMFKGWFGMTQTSYNRFVKALFQGDVDAMNYYMNEVSVQHSVFLIQEKKGVKIASQNVFIMVLFWDFLQTRQNSMKSGPTGKWVWTIRCNDDPKESEEYRWFGFYSGV